MAERLGQQRAAPEDVALARRLWLPASIQARQAVADLRAELPPPRRSPRGSWSSRSTGRRHFPRLLPRLSPHLRQPEFPALLPAAVGEEQVVEQRPLAAAAVEQAAGVVPHLCRFPGLDRSSPERLWSRGTRWPTGNAGTPITELRALTRAARFQLPATSYFPDREATLRSIAPIPASSFWIWISTSTRWGRP